MKLPVTLEQFIEGGRLVKNGEVSEAVAYFKNKERIDAGESEALESTGFKAGAEAEVNEVA